ncbi:helix-turn-helix domain-containing protein [Streptacidiphilus jiangxiensis]|uniref:Helix-turn-helix domain-containing protein n=1 Tax=Streptacidiphilus jiangxiensis TaxID=235985 RepID=A0A1H7KI53_STRJI|nr:helix-turn-helix domain-containing protein [Streptacidiphilus jiangxiensis]SEK86176.1 hypothetical protein SAMN05414137_10448 [Streptacidiphilus jiangxiensis]
MTPAAYGEEGLPRCVGHDCSEGERAQEGAAREGATSAEPVGRTVLPDLRLCHRCLRRFRVRLTELPQLHRSLEDLLGGGPQRGLRERVSGAARAPGLFFNERAAEARSGILTTLGSWAGLVAAERGVGVPERSVEALSRFLLRHLLWLAAHPAVADATGETARLVGAARAVTYAEPVRRTFVGDCEVQDCSGRLSVSVGGGRAVSEAGVRCDADPAHRWTVEQWSQREGAARAPERWLGAKDVSLLWGASMGTVYRLASEQSWRRVSRGGRTFYAESDVRRWFTRRTSIL